jgi:DNA primase
MTSFKEFSDKVRESANITDVIGSYIELRKSGTSHKALCPFHKEKTPSFFVSPTKQIFHCFGCNAGGDVFTFIKDYEKVDFKEAVLLLAKKLNIPVPSFRAHAEDASRDAYRNTLLEVHNLAVEYFRTQLVDAAAGGAARQYLKTRGIDPETERTFQLGFAPKSPDALLRHLTSKGYATKTLEDAGVISRTESAGHTDRFRGRLMFPIFDNIGRCVGFGGRLLDAGEPKYLNSPETLLYRKGRVLYGLNLAKEAFRERPFALLLEGYMDVLAAHQFGFSNAVATLGTALTDEQAQLLRKFVQEVCFLYDGDEAGQNAMLRGCEVLLRHDLRAKVAILPVGDDPDSYLRGHGAEKFDQLLLKAVDFFDFFLGAAKAKWDISGVDGKINTINIMKPMLKGIKDRLQFQDYQRRLAEALQLQEGLVADYLKDVGVYESETLRKEVEAKRFDKVHLAERELLKILIDNPCAREYISKNFEVEWVFDKKTRQIVEKVLSIEMDRVDCLSTLLDLCEDEEEAVCVRSVALWDVELSGAPSGIQQLLARLKMRYVKLHTLNVARQIEAFEKRDGLGRSDEAAKLAQAMHSASMVATRTHKDAFGRNAPMSEDGSVAPEK